MHCIMQCWKVSFLSSRFKDCSKSVIYRHFLAKFGGAIENASRVLMATFPFIPFKYNFAPERSRVYFLRAPCT